MLLERGNPFDRAIREEATEADELKKIAPACGGSLTAACAIAKKIGRDYMKGPNCRTRARGPMVTLYLILLHPRLRPPRPHPRLVGWGPLVPGLAWAGL